MLNVKSITLRTALVAGAAVYVLSSAPAFAANVVDASTCELAVLQSEQAIVKANVTGGDFDQLVALAGDAKEACDSEDFSKATRLTTEIDLALQKVASE